MKVVISGYVGKKITGIGRNLICLLDNSTSDIEYVIYTNFDMASELKFKNPNVVVKTYAISKNDSLKNLLWTTFVFPFKALEENADRGLIPNFTLLLFKFKPTTVIMHDLIEFNVPHKFSPKKMFYRTKLADPITAKRANHIITVSENSKRDIIKFLNVKDNKITVVYNGVDQDKFKKMDIIQADSILDNRGWPKEYILYAGTIDHPGKNAMNVIMAFEKLRKQNKYQGSLILAGMPGAGYEVIKNYIDNSEYRADIVLTGFVNDEELIALYSNCRVFCFVSLYEGFGIPPLEALACGAKVVVSNTSSLPEVVGDIGITVDPTDLDAITEVIYKGINLDANEEYRRKIAEHLRNYEWKNLSSDFEKVLLDDSFAKKRR